MELELKKECLDTYELGEPQTLTQEETAETIVPDYCPDIARIISAEGVVCLHGGTEQDGVTGTVRVTVLYTPENESGVRALEFAMPFSAQGEGLAGCAHVVVDTEIELLESRMLNPRKIFTRCKLVTHLAGCRKVCLTISSDAETDPALLVEKRCCGQTVSLLRQVAEKDLTFSETMSLSLGREGAAELLHCRANGIVTETKAIGNKLIFKGVFLVSVLYRTTGGQLASASAELPFSQIMETDSTEENTQVSMRLRITGTDIQIDGSDDEGRQLSVTVYYHTMAFLRETREVTLLTDLYSTAYETRYEPSQLELCSLYESVTRRQTVREVLEIGVAAEAVLSLCADCGAVLKTTVTAIVNTQAHQSALFKQLESLFDCRNAGRRGCKDIVVPTRKITKIKGNAINGIFFCILIHVAVAVQKDLYSVLISFFLQQCSGRVDRILLDIKGNHAALFPDQFCQESRVVSSASGSINTEITFFYLFFNDLMGNSQGI